MSAIQTQIGHETQNQAFDAGFLDRTRTQWLNGKWDDLVQLNVNSIENHPHRAELSLMIGSAWLQQGLSATARQYLHCAIDWGCEKQTIARVLSTGVKESLSRIAALRGDQLYRQVENKKAVDLNIETRQQDIELHKTTSITKNKKEKENSPKYPSQGITSYAQNFEDVMLWRALSDVKNGFYIDVGAWDPIIDSVSKGFYEKGWRGVHVEPNKEFSEKIALDRPDEKIYQKILSKNREKKLFFLIPKTGISTGITNIALTHKTNGWEIEPQIIEAITLKNIFDENITKEVHWLKIDVEGMEEEVLASWGDHQARPWIVVVEATRPGSPLPTWDKWEHHLKARDYLPAYFDGLNKFYIHTKVKYLYKQFSLPPNVFDLFKPMQTKK